MKEEKTTTTVRRCQFCGTSIKGEKGAKRRGWKYVDGRPYCPQSMCKQKAELVEALSERRKKEIEKGLFGTKTVPEYLEGVLFCQFCGGGLKPFREISRLQPPGTFHVTSYWLCDNVDCSHPCKSSGKPTGWWPNNGSNLKCPICGVEMFMDKYWHKEKIKIDDEVIEYHPMYYKCRNNYGCPIGIENRPYYFKDKEAERKNAEEFKNLEAEFWRLEAEERPKWVRWGQ